MKSTRFYLDIPFITVDSIVCKLNVCVFSARSNLYSFALSNEKLIKSQVSLNTAFSLDQVYFFVYVLRNKLK